jgi:hypothetical protein
MEKNRINVHHDVIYRFALRLKAIKDKACPVDFFPQTVRGTVRLLLLKKIYRAMRPVGRPDYALQQLGAACARLYVCTKPTLIIVYVFKEYFVA